MHLLMIFAALALAWSVRVSWTPDTTSSWSDRWERSLWFLVFPPLLLLLTGLAVLYMGAQGTMMGLRVEWLSYCLTLLWLQVSSVLGLKLAWEGWISIQQTRTYPLEDVGGESGRVLETPALYSAVIGFWQPELVVSQGLLQTLATEQLQAVIAHEQAHYHYRDTFWFFWLGWLRTCTAWLPYTEALWQELLLLRELRADRWAAQQVDPLILAESLVLVVSSSMLPMTSMCAAFSAVAQRDRLTERIEALLASPEPIPQSQFNWSWLWLFLAFLPLATVPFHT